jgi:hypothetical protein
MEIFHLNWSSLATNLIKMRLFCIYVESKCLTLHFLFMAFSSFLGGMGASIALLNEQDNFSCVLSFLHVFGIGFCPCLCCHSLKLLCTVHVYVVIHWLCYVLSIFNLSFVDPAMYCPCLCCHSLTPLCTVHVCVVIHWPCYVLSMFMLSFIDSAMCCPCLTCHSLTPLCTVHVYVVIHWPCYVLSMFVLTFIAPAMYCPCLCCHSLTLLCTVHV